MLPPIVCVADRLALAARAAQGADQAGQVPRERVSAEHHDSREDRRAGQDAEHAAGNAAEEQSAECHHQQQALGPVPAMAAVASSCLHDMSSVL